MRIKAFAPSTGEPALMIRDDKAFIAQLRKAKKISMDVTLVNGEKKQTLVYEVAGFDPPSGRPWARAARSRLHPASRPHSGRSAPTVSTATAFMRLGT